MLQYSDDIMLFCNIYLLVVILV